MKFRFLTSVPLIALLGGSAMAADLPILKAAPAAICPTCNWTGFYVGANVGGSIGWNRTDNSVSLDPPSAGAAGVTNPVSSLLATHSPNGALAGGQIGFNWQVNHLVVGVEADWNWTNQRDTIQSQNFLASSVFVAPASITYSDEQKLKWLTTTRLRLGWAHSGWLWYVTGGGAMGRIESLYAFQVTGSPIFSTDAATASFKTTKTGWVVGAGVETSLAWMGSGANKWSAKIEYLYVDLGTVNNSFTIPTNVNAPSAYTLTSSSRIQDHIVRVGLNYRLGGAADQPVRAAATAICPNCNWGGFYVGANVGGSLGHDRTDHLVTLDPPGLPAGVTNPISNLTAAPSPKGALAGGQIGFNWQLNSLVLGVEADWDWTSQRDSIQNQSFLASTFIVAPASLNYTEERKLKWLATARARVGWAHDCFLWYVTGGAAWGQIASNYTFQVNSLAFGGATFATNPTAVNSSVTKSGWTAGAGVETSLAWMGSPTNRWSAKIEYLYVDLGTVNNSFAVPVTADPTFVYNFSSSSRIQDHIVRIGLNYHFGG